MESRRLSDGGNLFRRKKVVETEVSCLDGRSENGRSENLVCSSNQVRVNESSNTERTRFKARQDYSRISRGIFDVQTKAVATCSSENLVTRVQL